MEVRIRTDLAAEVRAGDEETRRYMRVLHEDVISRIATLQDGPAANASRSQQTQCGLRVNCARS